MRHNHAGRRLGRKTSHREAMFRNMVTSLLTHEKITTTDAKAKEIRTVAEKMIPLANVVICMPSARLPHISVKSPW